MTIIRCIMIVLMISLSVSDDIAQLSFQVYVYDSETNKPLSTDYTQLKARLFDFSNNYYFESSQDQAIDEGVINVITTFNITSESDVFVFDQEGLQLELEFIDNGDTILIPMSSKAISIISYLSDRTIQMNDDSIFVIDYTLETFGIGTQPTLDTITVSGSVQADYFSGDAKFIRNATGAGLNDDHSLEMLGSRTKSNLYAETDADIGKDIVFVSTEAFVGVGDTILEWGETLFPEMPLDVYGTVLFMEGESNVGNVTYPLDHDQSILLWDAEYAAFRVGYVSRDASVSESGISDTSVGIGNDVAINGDYASIFGIQNSVTGNYSAIVGGQSNEIEAYYSVTAGGQNQIVKKGMLYLLQGLIMLLKETIQLF